MVDPGQPPWSYDFIIYGTGHDISDDRAASYRYLNTVFDGLFVWHVFWRP
jgi:hypothetical protein